MIHSLISQVVLGKTQTAFTKLTDDDTHRFMLQVTDKALCTEAGIQAGLCVIQGIYNIFGKGSLVFLMKARLAGGVFQKPCVYTAEADSPLRAPQKNRLH